MFGFLAYNAIRGMGQQRRPARPDTPGRMAAGHAIGAVVIVFMLIAGGAALHGNLAVLGVVAAVVWAVVMAGIWASKIQIKPDEPPVPERVKRAAEARMRPRYVQEVVSDAESNAATVNEPHPYLAGRAEFAGREDAINRPWRS